MEVAVLQVLYDQLQAVGAPGLVGAHRVNCVPAAQRAVPEGVVDGLVAPGCFLGVNLPSAAIRLPDCWLVGSSCSTMASAWARYTGADEEQAGFVVAGGSLMDNKCWGCRCYAQWVNSTMWHLRVPGRVPSIVLVVIYIHYY